jgi:hypothetical protein
MISYKQSPHSESISCTLRPQLHYIEDLLFIAVQVSQNIKTPPGELESQNIKTPPGELELDNTIEKKNLPQGHEPWVCHKVLHQSSAGNEFLN